MEQRNEENHNAKESKANAPTVSAATILYTHTLTSSDGVADTEPPPPASIERTDVAEQMKASLSPPPEGEHENKAFPPHDDRLFQEVMRAQLCTASPTTMPPPDTAAAVAGRTTCSQQQQIGTTEATGDMQTIEGGAFEAAMAAELDIDTTPTTSIRSIGSIVCRICHNAENPEKLVSPCLCKGSLTYVHIYCLERWISTSRSTICELCRFQYNTEQALRYTCVQSLRMWYSRSMSRRALQEDCQLFSMLTLIALCLIGVMLIGLQYYFLQGPSWATNRIWTKGWLLFILFTTLAVYSVNIYMIVRSQLEPWYRWWQSARDIKLVLENRHPIQYRTHSRRARNRTQIITEQLPLASTSTQSPYRPATQQPQQDPLLEHPPDEAAPPPVVPPSQPTVVAAIVSIGMETTNESPLPPLPLPPLQKPPHSIVDKATCPCVRYINATDNATAINMTPTRTGMATGSGGGGGGGTANAAISGGVSENPTTCNIRGCCNSV